MVVAQDFPRMGARGYSDVALVRAEGGGVRALQYAVHRSWDVRCVELLLDAAADIDLCRMPERDLPLRRGNLMWWAAGNPWIDESVVEILLQAKADLSAKRVPRNVLRTELPDSRVEVRSLRNLVARNMEAGGNLVSEMLRLGSDAHHNHLVHVYRRDSKVGGCNLGFLNSILSVQLIYTGVWFRFS